MLSHAEGTVECTGQYVACSGLCHTGQCINIQSIVGTAGQYIACWVVCYFQSSAQHASSINRALCRVQ